MTRNAFAALCSEYTIDPFVALENERVVDALRVGNDAMVEILLVTEF